MKKNIQKIERLLRLAAGLSIATLAVVGPEEPVYLLGLLVAFSGLVGFCPLYYLLGKKTCCCETK